MARGDFYTSRTQDMHNLKAIVDFWNGGNLVWFLSLAAVLGGLAWPKKALHFYRDHSAMLLAMILAAPHLKIQDLLLILIVVALVLAHAKRLSASQ
jgi:hypothetical protein